MNLKRCLLVGFTLTLASLLGLPCSRAERPIDVESAKAWAAQLRADIEFLAGDQLRGRSVADETIVQAAQYIAARMEAAGLKTDAVDGTPFQPVSVNLGARAGDAEDNRITITSADEETEPLVVSLGDGMNPMAIGSGSGEVSGRLVFVGYGITAPKLNYDDYEGVDVNGATVIVLRKEPRLSDPDSPFDGTRNSRHAFFNTKIENAIKHGAAAMILVNDPGSVLQSVQNERNKIKQELARKASLEKQLADLPSEAVNVRESLQEKLGSLESMVESMNRDLAGTQRGVLGISEAGQKPAKKDSIPIASLARDTVSQLLQDSQGKSLEEIEKAIDETTAPLSFELADRSIKLQIELKPTVAETSNVIGVIPGRGELADQTVVVGAHYDHVGMGGYGSLAPGTVAIHNGADDNASGTATMLAIASRMTEQLAGVDSHRTLVFIAFTAEERGLIGSKHYVDKPILPLANTAAMVNLDMVGRLRDNELTVYGTGTAVGLEELVDAANVEPQFELFKVASGYGPSDHQSFYEAGVPVLFFFTGLHNDYHRPSDDFDKIDFGGLTRITDIVSEVTLELARRQQRPEYAETDKRVRIRRQMTAFMGVSLSDADDHVVISGLVEGGPAERGGLRIGDRLEKLADREIKTASDVLQFMRTRSPGQQVKIQLLREGKTVETTIRLDPRPGG